MITYVAIALLLVTGFTSTAQAQGTLDPIANDTPPFTAAEVDGILTRAVAFLKKRGLSGVIAITDREGHVLTLYRVNPVGSTDVVINEQAIQKARTAAFFASEFGAFTTRTAGFIIQKNFPPGVANVEGGPLYGVPFSSFPRNAAATFLGANAVEGLSQVQIPPFIVFANEVNADGGGANFPAGTGNFRPAEQPLVITPITDDLGGLPLWKEDMRLNKRGKLKRTRVAAGAIGVEINGFGVLKEGIADAGQKRLADVEGTARLEEICAFAAQKEFRPKGKFRADRILVNGFRLPYTGKMKGARVSKKDLAAVDLGADGVFEPYIDTNESEREPTGLAAPASGPYPITIPLDVPFTTTRGTPTQEFPRQGWVPRFPARASPLGGANDLTLADVLTITENAAIRSNITRAAIRRPIGNKMACWISVVDRAGNLLGVFRTEDATIFSFDVAIQKARTAVFFSSDTAAFTPRAIGFMSQTAFPPGVDTTPPGPLSGLNGKGGGYNTGTISPELLTPPTPPAKDGRGGLKEISELLVDTTPPETLVDAITAENGGATPVGLAAQLAEAVQRLSRRMPHILDGRLSPVQLCLSVDLTFGTNAATTIPNGITIFPGGAPLYRNGELIGAVGVSGDGVDQDDIVAFSGTEGFEPPPGVRCDEMSNAEVQAALLIAVAKLKTQFPNLTNGADAVLDVLQQRIDSGNILQGLRLPYVKFPRKPNR